MRSFFIGMVTLRCPSYFHYTLLCN